MCNLLRRALRTRLLPTILFLDPGFPSEQCGGVGGLGEDALRPHRVGV